MTGYSGTGIFCFEGVWNPKGDLRDRTSVRPLLQMLHDMKIADFVHRDVATVPELEFYLTEWNHRRYQRFGILHFAMHGEAGKIHLAGKNALSLDKLGKLIGNGWSGHAIYFGSCLTMDASEDELLAFATVTGARLVVGYREAVNWIDAASFEIALLAELAEARRVDRAMTRLRATHETLMDKLGVVMATKAKVYP